MCLIMYSKNPLKISFDDMEQAFSSNKDGFGLMYVKNDRIIFKKILPQKFDEIVNLYNIHKTQTKEIALHFRFKTQGLINHSNCHPYKILTRKEHNRDTFLMHNGALLPIPILNDKKSDTHQFIEYYLRNILIDNIEYLNNKEFKELISDFIGNDKLLVLDSVFNKYTIFNQELGYFENNTWYSNSYFKTKKSKVSKKIVVNSNYNQDTFLCDYCEQQPTMNDSFLCQDCWQDEMNYQNNYYDDQDYNLNQNTSYASIPSFEQLSTMDYDELKIWVRSQIEDNKEDNIIDLIQSITQS